MRWGIFVLLLVACKRDEQPTSSTSAPTASAKSFRARKSGPPRGRGNPASWVEGSKLLNPVDPKGRPIIADGTKCSALDRETEKTEPIDCPESMDDPAWDECPALLYREPAGKCFCTILGCGGDNHCKVNQTWQTCTK
jgi:hypothetical protein